METDEIGIVLARASELNARISEAIERAMKSDIIHNKMRLEPRTRTESEDKYGSCSHSGDLNARDGECASGVETRNLVSIRDALEVLEQQLECLQALQQQQRVEKEATLADLEESRLNLLGRLRNYQGREWEVVQQALTFAGETMDEGDDLHLPPYLNLVPDNRSCTVLDGQPVNCYDSPDSGREHNAMKQLAWTEENDELLASEVDEGSQINEEVIDNDDLQMSETEPQNIIGIMQSNICKFIGSPVGKAVTLAAKTVIVAAGLVAVVTLANVGKNKQSKGGTYRVASAPPRKTLPFNPTGEKDRVLEEKCPPEKVMVSDDNVQKGVLNEQIERPSQKEVEIPRVFYGRG